MTKTRLLLSAALGAVLLSSPAAFAQGTMDKAKTEVKEDYNKAKSEVTGKKVQLSAVPAPAMAAGKTAAPGTTFTEAKQSTEDGATVYELEGRDAAKKKHSVHVTSGGKVLRQD
jgi:uncharacterized membrane protein YkoI